MIADVNGLRRVGRRAVQIGQRVSIAVNHRAIPSKNGIIPDQDLPLAAQQEIRIGREDFAQRTPSVPRQVDIAPGVDIALSLEGQHGISLQGDDGGASLAPVERAGVDAELDLPNPAVVRDDDPAALFDVESGARRKQHGQLDPLPDPKQPDIVDEGLGNAQQRPNGFA